MHILAIETSCDETSAAVLEASPVKSRKAGQFNRVNFDLKSHLISSQVKLHTKYGGIVPEVAARKQMEMIIPILKQALKLASSKKQAPISKKDIDYIAVTQGPGLITSLTVGVETAKTLALVLNKPLIPVNHLVGHLLANHLNSNEKITGSRIKSGMTKRIKYPAVGLIVSGGHTMLVYMKNESNYKIIGQTLDDAAGEAFDKVAKILNLGYPGGPIISKLAEKGNSNAFKLPRPMIQQNNLDFSFSGLKTAVLYLVKKLGRDAINRVSTKADLCASFQQAVIDVLVSKTLRAIKQYSSSAKATADKKPKSFLLGGGVAANSELRKQLQKKLTTPPLKGHPSLKRRGQNKIEIFIPELKFTGDNAAMIAVAAYFKTINNKQSTTNNIKKIKADPNLMP